MPGYRARDIPDGMVGRYTLHRAIRADHGDLAEVMFDAVRHGPSLYSEEQRAQWMPQPRSGADWDDRLGGQIVMLARDVAGVAGFMSIAPGGFIDLAFIRPRSQRTGLFRRLFWEIEAVSVARGDGRMWTHASLMAQPAFAAMGFAIVEHQTVAIGGQTFDRAEMEKRLGGGLGLAGRHPEQFDTPTILQPDLAKAGQTVAREAPDQFTGGRRR